jgi:general secretion pathway protein A
MYERFFGLRERPFDLTPNPRYLYLTGRHREALSNLQYGITGRRGITLLIGEAGTGKTTLVRAAIESMASPALRCVYLSNPVLTRAEFYEFLAPKFGLSDRAALSKARFLADLEESLLARNQAGGTTALIIDEAQSAPAELLEEVRLLANFETATEKLLPVVLAGQPELAARLDKEDLRQLKQRVALRCDLSALDIRETAAYISGRLGIAGGESAKIFTREAVQAIHLHSRGIPRTISVICDNALVTGFAAGTKPIDSSIVLEVCRDFNLEQPPADTVTRAPSAARWTMQPLAGAGQQPATPRGERVVDGTSRAAAGVGQGGTGSGAPGNGNGYGRAPMVARAFTPVAVTSPPPAPRAQVPAPAFLGRRTVESPPPPAEDVDDRLFSLFGKKKRFWFFGL